MGYVIAMAGKGGTGKTTLAALIVRIIKEKKLGSILAVDADPNNNLSEALGVGLKETIGQILDDIALHPEKVPTGMSKDRFVEYEVQTAIVEGDGFDLLTMGKPEGPGCYCYVNNVLRNVMVKLIKDYAYTVIDNEAGLEHLSRRTTRSADALVIVSDATYPGLKAAGRISDLAKELDIKTKKNLLIINRSEKDIEKDKIKDLKLDYLGFIPQDNGIEKISLNGGSLMDLIDDAVSLSNLLRFGEKIWQRN
ncbi:MAG: AAA family ATPase [Candidatus Omnitrophica bacterium]|nr:AAA family ATPase [Candidatus Omnitrophota bacterium]